jgi:hypothetical protein
MCHHLYFRTSKLSTLFELLGITEYRFIPLNLSGML